MDINVPRNKKWEVTLNKKDTRPYGTYLAYQSLDSYFPGAKIDTISRGFRYSDMDERMKYNKEGASLLVLIGLDFSVSQYEWIQLEEFAKAGNEVMLFCSSLDRKIEEQLNCYKRNSSEEYPLGFYNSGKENIGILSLKDIAETYGYEGRSLRGYFSGRDTSYYHHKNPYRGSHDTYTEDTSALQIAAEDTLGFAIAPAVYGGPKPDFIRFKIGEGHITIHGAPLVLSNYFLLQNNNVRYLDGIWSALPGDIKHIYWNEYYKRAESGYNMSVLWQYPSTRWALIIALITLALYVLFEGKRRQRIIPIITPLENSSVSFVETVGRLYYNKKNHENLAEKMIQHFLEWVRNHYYLNTNHLNEDFIQRLAIKSGMHESTVRHLVDTIHEIRLGNAYTDEAYLYDLYNTIEQFYKNKHS